MLGGAAASWPLARLAQALAMPLVGELVTGKPDPAVVLRSFLDGLRDLGYVEGRNIRIEVRSAEGKTDRLPELAASLVRDKPDVIAVRQTPPALAAKQATTRIPIVMLTVGDPVRDGLVASLPPAGRQR
jgi:putative ABC transport system substrate-binding protein